jgi:formamidopyrimidine-DNA glycosylase
MPELPEVEVIVRELKPELIGEIICGCEILWERTFVSERGTLPLNLIIHSISRKGKYIVMTLSKGALVVHLRMTGQLLISYSDLLDQEHVRLIFRLSSGKNLYFFDSRKFGRIYFVKNPEEIISKIGIDALDPSLSESKFFELLGKRQIRIKSFLLDQRFLSGLGNIYIDECLFKAGIHPETKVNFITRRKRKKLLSVINEVLVGAIQNMGTTISDYKTTGGGFGTNQKYLTVYDRENMPCLVCHDNVRKIRVNGRGTHFCPTCQPQVKEIR